VIDVGGQKNERKKWTQSFENVSVLIFVASLGDFDQMCYEDDITNRMKDAIELFEKIANHQKFINNKVLLLLNKKDILVEKLKTKDLIDCFEDYKGGRDFDKAVEFITQQFLKEDKGEKGRITAKVIQAIDPQSVANVFDEIKSSLKQQFK